MKRLLILFAALFIVIMALGFRVSGYRLAQPLTGTDSVLNGATQDTIYNLLFGDAAFVTITALEDLGNASFFFITTAEDTVFVNLSDDPGANISYKWVLIEP